MVEVGSQGSLPVLRLKDVSFSYEGDITALEGITLEGYPGDFIAVFGANGAGKSTLCYLITGIIPNIYGGRRTGEVWVNGADPWDRPIYDTARGCSMVLQDPEAQLFMPDLFMELSFGPANLGVQREEIRRRIARVLDIVGLAGMEKRSTKALSGGQKQRAALGSVLTMLPSLLVLDEPTSQLDPLGSDEVLRAIANIRQTTNMTIIMTTHKTEEIMGLANKALVLDHGRIAVSGSLDEVFSDVDRLERVGVQPPPLRKFYCLLRDEVLAGANGRDLLPPLDSSQLTLPALADVVTGLADRGILTVDGPAAPADSHPAPGQPLLEIRDLTYVYPGEPPVTALDDVSLTIHAGEFVGIVGQNGSGKTTLVKSIVGLLKPTGGSIRFHGVDMTTLSVGEIATRIGLVLQNPDYQLFTTSADEEVMFGLTNIKLPEAEARARAERALALTGLAQARDTFPFKLSFGDRRKLAVAAVMAMEPEVLILDEPTTAQDYRGRYLLADIARELRQKHGRTILMISHDMELLARYAERLIVMWNGRVLLDGPAREVFQQETMLEKTYLLPPDGCALAHLLSGIGVPPGALTIEEILAVLKGGARHADSL